MKNTLLMISCFITAFVHAQKGTNMDSWAKIDSIYSFYSITVTDQKDIWISRKQKTK